MCIHLFLMPTNAYAVPVIIRITPAIDRAGVILGFSGSGSGRARSVPFVTLFTAVDVGVWLARIVDEKWLAEAVRDRCAGLELNTVNAPGPCPEGVVDAPLSAGNPLLS